MTGRHGKRCTRNRREFVGVCGIWNLESGNRGLRADSESHGCPRNPRGIAGNSWVSAESTRNPTRPLAHHDNYNFCYTHCHADASNDARCTPGRSLQLLIAEV